MRPNDAKPRLHQKPKIAAPQLLQYGRDHSSNLFQAQAQVKIGKRKNAELIFDHGLLLSRKFFISDSEIVRKYQSKVKPKRKSPTRRNFIEMNKKVLKSPSSISLASRNMSPSGRSHPETKIGNFVNINVNSEKKTRSNKFSNRVTSAVVKRSRRVHSAFENPIRESSPIDKGNRGFDV